LLLFCLAAPAAWGSISGSPPPLASPIPAAPGLLCRTAIAVAERAANLPPQLLAAIGRVESGRRDPRSDTFHPWPWAVNAEGQGTFYDTKAEAMAAVAVATLQARGVRSVDVGCAQVNLMHHPDAFASLEQAFDPERNTAYAATLLNQLHTQSGDWRKAAALYHSATPELGADYQRKVLAAWTEERRLAGNGAVPGNAISGNAGTGGFLPPPRGTAARIIPLAQAAGAAQGRGLDAYRARPITLTSRSARLGG
jgi:hypothetical protein